MIGSGSCQKSIWKCPKCIKINNDFWAVTWIVTGCPTLCLMPGNRELDCDWLERSHVVKCCALIGWAGPWVGSPAVIALSFYDQVSSRDGPLSHTTIASSSTNNNILTVSHKTQLHPTLVAESVIQQLWSLISSFLTTVAPVITESVCLHECHCVIQYCLNWSDLSRSGYVWLVIYRSMANTTFITHLSNIRVYIFVAAKICPCD